MNGLSIRWRLTLWYGAVLLTVVCGFGSAIYWMVSEAIEKQADAEVVEELGEFRSQLETATTLQKKKPAIRRFFELHPQYLFEARTQDGQIVSSESRLGIALPPPKADDQSDDVQVSTRSIDGQGRYRMGSQSFDFKGETVHITLGIPLTPYEQVLQQFLNVLFTAGPLVLVGALAGGYFLACRALSPVEDVCRTAERITAERLDERIKTPNPNDELGRLARAFNCMLERLEYSFQELRVFTADASHELRTPLAILRSTLDVALRAERTPERYQDVLRDAVEDVERLCQLADGLLLLSQDDAGFIVPSDRPVRIDTIVTDAIASMQQAADARGVILVENCLPELVVAGDVDRLRQVWINLLDNAIKYTPAGGHVVIHSESDEAEVRVIVKDSGTGIPSEEVCRVFDRFYRVDPSRNNGTGGAGLGLAICKAIITAHGGTIEIMSSSRQGTSVLICLPAYRSVHNAEP